MVRIFIRIAALIDVDRTKRVRAVCTEPLCPSTKLARVANARRVALSRWCRAAARLEHIAAPAHIPRLGAIVGISTRSLAHSIALLDGHVGRSEELVSQGRHPAVRIGLTAYLDVRRRVLGPVDAESEGSAARLGSFAGARHVALGGVDTTRRLVAPGAAVALAAGLDAKVSVSLLVDAVPLANLERHGIRAREGVVV